MRYLLPRSRVTASASALRDDEVHVPVAVDVPHGGGAAPEARGHELRRERGVRAAHVRQREGVLRTRPLAYPRTPVSPVLLVTPLEPNLRVSLKMRTGTLSRCKQVSERVVVFL